MPEHTVEETIPVSAPVSASAIEGSLPAASILVVDDEASIRESLEVLLSLENYSVKTAANGEEGLRMLDQASFDLVLLDLALPGQSGIELLPQFKERQPDLPVIMITAYGTVDNVVEAIRAGAENFVQKPWDNEKLLADIRSAVARHRAEEENLQLKRTLKQRYNFANIVGKSESMLRIFDLVAQVAPSRSTVLIQGESGTGKEIIAKAIHANSPRRDKPFVPINTGAMPSELLESTLFGHVKGAFTGAYADTLGKVAAADGGTLFLDEIGELPLEIQAKLLRLLQEREYERVGESKPRRANVRVISATNRDLAQAVADGKFREDLFYRLNVISLRLPPLRDRMDDLEKIARSHLTFLAGHAGKNVRGFSPDALTAMRQYAWPGNLRELHNVIERAVILCSSEMIEADDLSDTIQTSSELRLGGKLTVHEIETEHIRRVVASTRNLDEAATILGIDPATLYRKRKKLF